MLSSFVALIFQLLAQTGPPGSNPDPMPSPPPGMGDGGAGQPGSMLTPLLMFGALFLLMYLFVFRPQTKRDQEEKSMLEKLKKDDHVVTKGGMYGVVVNLKDDEVTLRIDENQNTKVRFQKSAIAAILGEDDKNKGDAKKS
jgi:preprotein translocase subunit YajC